MFRLARVIVRIRSEPFGFSSIITYGFLFWRMLVGVKWWLALHWYEQKFKNIYQEMLLGKPFNRKSFTPARSESYTRTEVHPPLRTDQQPPQQETIRGNPRRSSDTSRRAQKPVLLYSFVSKILYISILRCVWIVRRLDEYYAVPHYYMYRKHKWSAAETSEPKCASYVKLTWHWNIKRLS
jgi:hypothetical protein